MTETEAGTSEKNQDLVRYNLALPHDLWDPVVERARRKHSSIRAVLRQYIEAGYEIEQALESGATIIKKQENKKTELLII